MTKTENMRWMMLGKQRSRKRRCLGSWCPNKSKTCPSPHQGACWSSCSQPSFSAGEEELKGKHLGLPAQKGLVVIDFSSKYQDVCSCHHTCEHILFNVEDIVVRVCFDSRILRVYFDLHSYSNKVHCVCTNVCVCVCVCRALNYTEQFTSILMQVNF